MHPFQFRGPGGKAKDHAPEFLRGAGQPAHKGAAGYQPPQEF